MRYAIEVAIGFAMAFAPTALALLASAVLSRRSEEEWKLLAWVPSVPLVGWWLYTIIMSFVPDGLANTWPLTMVIPLGAAIVLFAVFLVARKLTGSGSPKRPWQH